MSLFSGSFAIQRNESELADTFLHLPGWHKVFILLNCFIMNGINISKCFQGFVFLNDINLGRYWPVQGPQVTLYVPKYFLKPWPAKNRLLVIEQDKSPCIVDDLACTVEFIDRPILNADTPAQMKLMKHVDIYPSP